MCRNTEKDTYYEGKCDYLNVQDSKYTDMLIYIYIYTY